MLIIQYNITKKKWCLIYKYKIGERTNYDPDISFHLNLNYKELQYVLCTKFKSFEAINGFNEKTFMFDSEEDAINALEWLESVLIANKLTEIEEVDKFLNYKIHEKMGMAILHPKAIASLGKLL